MPRVVLRRVIGAGRAQPQGCKNVFLQRGRCLGPMSPRGCAGSRGRWGRSGWLCVGSRTVSKEPPGAFEGAVRVFPEPKPFEPALEKVGFNQAKEGCRGSHPEVPGTLELRGNCRLPPWKRV